jgi:hypothetical protein
MNKQELIDKIEDLREEGESDLRTVIYFAKQLDEPSMEECELISNEYNICNCCSYNLNNLIKEIVVGCDNDDFECGGAVVHQVFWTDKYMNYCPNCGAKIKKEKKR